MSYNYSRFNLPKNLIESTFSILNESITPEQNEMVSKVTSVFAKHGRNVKIEHIKKLPGDNYTVVHITGTHPKNKNDNILAIYQHKKDIYGDGIAGMESPTNHSLHFQHQNKDVEDFNIKDGLIHYHSGDNEFNKALYSLNNYMNHLNTIHENLFEAKKSFDIIKHLKGKGFFDIQKTGNTYFSKFPDHVKNELVDLHRKGLIKTVPEVRGIRSRDVDG